MNGKYMKSTWQKMLKALIPFNNSSESSDSRDSSTHAKSSVKSMREQTFQVNGPKLFNSLPVKLRNMTKCSLEDFKAALDNYLAKVPDEPSVSGLTPGGCTPEARASNSILDQAKRINLAG